MTLSNIPVVRLGDVVDRVTKGTTPTTHGYPYTKDGVAFVRVENLRNGIIDASTVTTFISVDADRFLKRSSLEKDDVLVSIAGTIGRTAIVREHDLPANTNQAVAIIRGANRRFEPVFLRYALESPLLNRLLTGEARGGAMQNISLEDVKNVKLPVPPIDQQRQIVAEIEKQFTRLEAGVASLQRVQANLKHYRAAVLKAACEGKLVPTEAELARQEGRSYETGAQLLDRILTERRQNWQGRGNFVEPAAPDATAFPKLPEDWTWTTVEQLSNVVRGASPRPAGDPRYFGGSVPWITVGPLTADNSPYLKSVAASVNELGREHSRYIEAQTLLLTNSGATLGVPKITLIGGCINDGVAALLDVAYPLKLYLLYFLRTQTERLRGVNQGAAQPNLNTTIIKAINVPLPPLAEQTRIVAEVERRLSVVEELEALVSANLRRTTRLCDSILQKAFTRQLG